MDPTQAPARRRRTKIVATLGPASSTPEALRGLIDAGADVFRLNFSHGTPEQHGALVAAAREAAKEANREVAILGDLQGPKIRIDKFRDGPVMLEEGARFTLDVGLDADAGTVDSVGVTYKALPKDVRPGDVLLLADGQIVLDVEAVERERIITRVATGGELSNNKGINRQGGGLSAEALTDKDREDIKTAAALEVDYLAVSFPREGADMDYARRLLKEAGGDALLVAKVERAEAIVNLEDIIKASDVIMIARGDLGVEIGYAELPALQKEIINTTRALHKVTITATQMMESMISNPIPTRAEVSDVANAVIDGTDAVMLSAESAVGRYPTEAVAAMANACQSAERVRTTMVSGHRLDAKFAFVDEAIAMATMYVANHLDVAAIIALTESGSTARWLSRISSGIPIFAFTRHERTRRRVKLYRGVYPVAFDITHTSDDHANAAIAQTLLSRGIVKEDDHIILTGGDFSGVAGCTNNLRIVKVAAGELPPTGAI
ncbi:MAG: pyruvate kinase [Pseudomonadota bacterium]